MREDNPPTARGRIIHKIIISFLFFINLPLIFFVLLYVINNIIYTNSITKLLTITLYEVILKLLERKVYGTIYEY